jgi:hypothetical protein
VAWRLFYSDINELSPATESAGVNCRQVPQAKSAVDIRFSSLGIGDLAVILINQPG